MAQLIPIPTRVTAAGTPPKQIYENVGHVNNGDARLSIGRVGAVGARQGIVEPDAVAYKDGKPGGFDPHARIPDMDADGIDAAFLYPSIGLFSGAIHDPQLAAADDHHLRVVPRHLRRLTCTPRGASLSAPPAAPPGPPA